MQGLGLRHWATLLSRSVLANVGYAFTDSAGKSEEEVTGKSKS